MYFLNWGPGPFIAFAEPLNLCSSLYVRIWFAVKTPLVYHSIELSYLPSNGKVVFDEDLWYWHVDRNTVAEIRSEHKANALELPANQGTEQDPSL